MKTEKERREEISIPLEFMKYVNQFSHEGIEFTFYKKKEQERGTVFGISYDNTLVDWYEGKPEPTTSKDEPMTEKFYHRLLRDSSCNEIRFIERNLKHLNSLPEKIQLEFKFIFDPLRELFEKAQQNGGLKKLHNKIILENEPLVTAQTEKKNYSEYTVAAFCYYFLMKAGDKPDYKSGKKQLQGDAVRAICNEAKLIAPKKFQLLFNKLYDCVSSKLHTHLKRGDRQEIFNRLKLYPSALSIAERNLTEN